MLSNDEITKKLEKLPVEWALIGGANLELALDFDDFEKAHEFVDKVSAVANELNHHPDINFGYGYARISITTHSEGGLTDKDFEFAEKVEKTRSR